MAEELLSPGGRLSSEKTFSRSDVVVAVAPMLHGLPVSVLDDAVDRVLSHEQAVALPLVTGAREPVWAAACVVEDEQRIASLADVLAEREGPRVDRQAAFLAVRQLELSRGVRLSERQAEVAKGLLTAGHSLDLVVGVAGSGKTTMLAAVRSGFEAAGYKVVGTATSGQAAKALGEGAGIESRTVASLTWRLEHNREVLSRRHVVILDESGMTSDADMGRLLAAVEASGAKLVAVGDYRQLDAVGRAAHWRPCPSATRDTCGRCGTTCARSTRASVMHSTTCAPGTYRLRSTGTSAKAAPPCGEQGAGHLRHGHGLGRRRRRRPGRPDGRLPPRLCRGAEPSGAGGVGEAGTAVRPRAGCTGW